MLCARNRRTPSAIVEHIVRAYLDQTISVSEIAEDIKPLEIQRWLKSLHETDGLAWTTIAKMRGLMHRIYKVGILHEHVAKNPVLHVETRSKTDLPGNHHHPGPDRCDSEILTLAASLHAGAHLRGDCAPLVGDSGAALGDVLWDEGRIQDFKALGQGRGRRNKNRCVGWLRPTTSGFSRASSRVATPDAACEGNGLCVSVVQSARARFRSAASVFVADHLRPAAKKAGVHIEDGQRFGLHNLRHSLSNWLVNKAKVEPKTVQGILRHAKIQTTLDLYTQEDSDETRAAQGEFLNAVGMSTAVN